MERIPREESLERIISQKFYEFNSLTQDDIKKSSEKFRILRYESEKIKPIRRVSSSPDEILKPLESVFFDDDLMDELVIRTSIPQLIGKQLPLYPGVILFGPGGTGKSEFQKAVCEVYENAGAYSKQVSSSNVNSVWVGQFAKNLEEELVAAQTHGQENGLPSFLSFDEGTIFAQKASSGAVSVSKHYQEAIDTFKRYIGNEAGSHLVIAISTNLLPQDFEEPMVRDGRLTTFFIDYPSLNQVARMWKYFLSRDKVIDINDEQAYELAEMTGRESGAFIDQFSKTYEAIRRKNILQVKGFPSLLGALKNGMNIPESEIRGSINYEILKADLQNYLDTKRKRNENGVSHRRKPIGFAQE